MLALFGLHLPVWTLLVAALVNGIALQADRLAWTSLLQEKIPNEELGLVFSFEIARLVCVPAGWFGCDWLGNPDAWPQHGLPDRRRVDGFHRLLALLVPDIRNLD